MELLESDSARPRQARYQAALRPDMKLALIIRSNGTVWASTVLENGFIGSSLCAVLHRAGGPPIRAGEDR